MAHIRCHVNDLRMHPSAQRLASGSTRYEHFGFTPFWEQAGAHTPCLGSRTVFHASKTVLVHGGNPNLLSPFSGSHSRKSHADFEIRVGRCLNTNRWFLGSTISSVIIDVYIMFLPLPVLWTLHTGRARKVVLTGFFFCAYW